jgi:hypothetical protein
VVQPAIGRHWEQRKQLVRNEKGKFGGGKKRLEILPPSTWNEKIRFEEEHEGNYVRMARTCEA